ncbi:MAG: hypothetical protein II350_01735 [Clostridia bacterium]|nr:hypothetical protein [Clostridia bacterium]
MESPSMNYSSVSAVKKQGRLLFDGNTVEKAENCRLKFFSAVKDPASPFITKTEDWEGVGPYTWCSRLFFIDGVYRLYYMAYDKSVNHYRTGIAESADGLTWTKPRKAKKEYNGKTIDVSLDTPELPVPCHPWRAIAIDKRPACPESERFKGYSFSYQGGRIFLSPDGYIWHEYKDSPVWSGTSDIVHMMHDDNTGKFLSYYKLWRVCGVTAEEEPKEVSALFTTFDVKDLPDGTVEISGPQVTHVSDGADIICQKTYHLQSGNLSANDGGGGHLSGKWYSRRVVCRSESEDFFSWKNGKVVLETDSADRPDSNIQIAQIFFMGGYYVAFLTIHDQRGFFEQQLAFSSDGIKWHRPWRGNLISRGAKGEFDSGMVTQPVDPLILGSQMLLYYGGTPADHTQVNDFSIGRAILRKDGFAAWDSPGDEARLKTVPLEAKNGDLELNVNAEGGFATAALFDEDGTPVPSCTHENCIPLTENSVAYPDCYIPVRWKGTESPISVGKKYSVEIKFKDAELYSVLI